MTNSKTWQIFCQWYEKNRESKKYNFNSLNLQIFLDLDFEFQSGVFEKFIEDQGFHFEKTLHKVAIFKKYNCIILQPTAQKTIEMFFHGDFIDNSI